MRFTWTGILGRFQEIIARTRAVEMAQAVFGFPTSLPDMATLWAALCELLAASPQVVNVKSFGAKGDGVTDDSAAFQAMANALAALGTSFHVVIPPLNYVLNSKVSFTLPQLTNSVANCVFEAYGARFTTPNDIVMFDLAPSADPLDPTTGLRAHVRWKGGWFRYTGGGVPSVAMALNALNFRNLKVEDARFENFFVAVQASAEDTYKFTDCHFYNNYTGISIPDWSDAVGGSAVTLMIMLDNCHFAAPTGKTAGLKVDSQFINLHVDRCSFNGDFHGVWATNSDGQSQLVTVKKCHFEQAAATTKNVWLNDTAGTGAFLAASFENNTFSSTAGTGLKLERTQRVQIRGNIFSHTTAAGGLPFDIDVNCSDVFVDRSNVYAGTAFGAYALTRASITFAPEVRSLFDNVLTGFNGATFSTAVATTITMSTALGASYPTEAKPKGYWINVQASDSGSAASTTAGVSLARPSATAARKALLSLAGAPNNVVRGMSCYVPADSNGDIAYTPVASGAGTLTLTLSVTGIAM